MIGLTVLAAIAAYVGLTWFAVRKLKEKWAKAIVIVVALAIPFWDLPIGYFKFQHYCTEYGGMHLNADLPPTDTILVDRDLSYTPEQLSRYGFRTIEYGVPGAIVRYTLSPSGFHKSSHDSPLSTLKIQTIGNQMLSWNVVRRDFIASRVDTGQIVARYTDLRWRGLWWQVNAAPILGDGGRCYAASENPVLALIPRGSK